MFYAEMLRDKIMLRQVGDQVFCFVGRFVYLAIDADEFLSIEGSENNLHEGALAAAIPAQQTNDLACAALQINVGENAPFIKVLLHAVYFKNMRHG